MSSKLSMFPVLSNLMLEKVYPQLEEYNFFYSIYGKEHLLLNERIGKYGTIRDKEGVWNSINNNLIIKINFTLKNLNILFGENGIICNDSILGIALLWSCHRSKMRGAIPIGEIINGVKEKKFYLTHEFKKGVLKGSLNLKIVFYLKKEGIPQNEEYHLANESGCILGQLDEYEVLIEGKGSLFPIYEINEVNEPLWKLSLEWEDPTYSNFSDSVAIYINKKHKGYKYLDKTKKTFNEELLKEIMTRSMIIMIMKVKESAYWESTINGQELERGSVSQLIYYFITTLKWDISSIELLSDSISLFFEERIDINNEDTNIK